WERNPDDRIDDYGIAFAWASDVAYPDTTQTEGLINGHSLRIEVKPGNIELHGVHQSGIPIRSGLEYRGYLWVKADAFSGDVEVALEADRTGGRVYGSARITGIAGDWKKYPFTVKSSTSDPLARFAIRVSGIGTLWMDQVSLVPGDAVDDLRAD